MSSKHEGYKIQQLHASAARVDHVEPSYPGQCTAKEKHVLLTVATNSTDCYESQTWMGELTAR